MRMAWRSVGAIITGAVADADADRDRLDGLRRIGIDEISHRKAHRYITVVVDHARVAWCGPPNPSSEATLAGFFDALGPERSGAIELVSSDGAGWIPAGRAATLCQGHPVHRAVHVVSWATDALDVVRREVWNAARRSGETNEPLYRAYLLKRSYAWCSCSGARPASASSITGSAGPGAAVSPPRRTRPQGHPAPSRHRGDTPRGPLERADRGGQHADPTTHLRRLRVPLGQCAHRARDARLGRALSATAGGAPDDPTVAARMRGHHHGRARSRGPGAGTGVLPRSLRPILPSLGRAVPGSQVPHGRDPADRAQERRERPPSRSTPPRASSRSSCSDSPWDDEGCIGELQRFVGEHLGTPCAACSCSTTPASPRRAPTRPGWADSTRAPSGPGVAGSVIPSSDARLRPRVTTDAAYRDNTTCAVGSPDWVAGTASRSEVWTTDPGWRTPLRSGRSRSAPRAPPVGARHRVTEGRRVPANTNSGARGSSRRPVASPGPKAGSWSAVRWLGARRTSQVLPQQRTRDGRGRLSVLDHRGGLRAGQGRGGS